MPIIKCGCGEKLKKFDKQGRSRKFIKGGD